MKRTLFGTEIYWRFVRDDLNYLRVNSYEQKSTYVYLSQGYS